MRNNCIEIEFYDLPVSAKNRLGADSALLDITDNEAIRLTKNVEALTNANKLQTDGAQPFSAPSNPTNDAIFVEYITPNVVDNRREFYNVRVRIAGHPLTFNRLVVTSPPKTIGGEWGLELRRSPDHWIELAGTKFVNTIDFGEFELTRENIIANWEVSKWKNAAGDVPYIWPVMDYGNWVDRSVPPIDSQINKYKVLGLEDLRPLISLPYLLKQGFCEIGWTLEGLIFDTDFIAGLYCYILNSEYYKAGSTMAVSVLQTTNRVYTGASSNRKLVFNTLDFSNLNDISLGSNIFCGIKNNLVVNYNYTFEFSAIIGTSTPGTPIATYFFVMDLDSTTLTEESIISEQVEVVVNGDTEVFISIDWPLRQGMTAALCMLTNPNLTIKAGARGKVYPNDKSFYTGQTVTIKNAVETKNTLLTYFKAFCHLTRSQIITDEVTKTVTLYPKKSVTVFNENVSGFYLDEQPSVDISNLVVFNSEQLKLVRPEQKRFLEVGFKGSSDAFIKSLELQDEPYRKKILNSELLPDETTEIYNPLFEPTLEGEDTLLSTKALVDTSGFASIIVPRMWDNDNRNRSFNILPRLFYSYGKIKQIGLKRGSGVNQRIAYAGFFIVDNTGENVELINEFAYASMLPTREVEPTPDFYGNLTFEKQVFDIQFRPNSDPDLFSTFYLNITNELRGGFEIDLLMLLNMNAYQSIDFRRYYRFMYRGRPINAAITQVRDFVGCSGIATPATFFIEPTESECCNLPCGCQFSTCEYYQDFGQFMTQSTLDSLSITKFEVDGVSVTSSPVSFGIIKIINILGRPFVANLVDTLNSIGAPYMAFDYAYRLDPVKGARFFTIKKPICQGFIIEISNSTEVLYRYTESLQEQTWFGSGFSAFGYGANLYSEPENCIQSTEY